MSALLLLAISLASAHDVPGQAEFERGQTAYQQGDYETAISEWNASYAISAQPLILYNVSLAYERLGRLEDAAAALDRYLETASADETNQANARARRAAIRERIARTGILVEGGPEGAELFVDDRSWGLLPRPDRVPVEPGSHRVRVVHDDILPFEATVVVTAGDVATLEVDAQDAPDAPGSTPIVPWVLVGAGGAAILTGAILGVLAIGRADGSPASDGPDADAARNLALGADVSIGAGVIAAGIGLAWILFFGEDAVF